ncbi:CHASE3 domain-containing protein [Variovorax ginsengisoli]|uniref:Signal transduction histidine kinase n=1 Tax=Variovorax ginsengisoli TaxID=363844 RepID=A0ABT9S623_9BURK|nr:CHASE3 domain-containing protein [Variovorax ginsengisoli]MDP9899816.1 signal transduction histidine kinase [Variovorax ginsengisoli]
MALNLVLAALAALVLIGINEAGYRQSRQEVQAVRETQVARLALNKLLQDIVDAETGQRGYLLTGEPSYRAPYDAAIASVNDRIDALRKIYRSDAREAAAVEVLAGHVARKLAEMEMSVRLRKSNNEDAWKFVITTDVGREEMQAIRAQVATLMAFSDQTLAHGQRQIAQSLAFGRFGIPAVVLAALIAFVLYLRQTAALHAADQRQQTVLQRERNALEGEVRDRTATLAELATHLQNVRESERAHLARELHDELGSLLTAAKLDVARLRSRLADIPDAIQRLQHLTELLNSGIALKRRIIEDLRPSSLSNLGLVASLEILGREFAERSAIQVEMTLEPVELDDAKQLTVYRMVQESLTNIGKYAQATKASVTMKTQGHQVLIEVGDDGQGFDTESVRPSTHGLTGMRHRVEAAHGTLTVVSTPGAGSRLSARLPTTGP